MCNMFWNSIIEVLSKLSDFGMSEQLISGVGNEVLFSCALAFLSGFPIFMYLCCRRSHPSNVSEEVSEQPAATANEVPVAPVGYNREICPICLAEHVLPIESNCGHLFCGTCLRYYSGFQSGTLFHCPLCRAQITMLFVCFTPSELEDGNLREQRDSVYSFVDAYNRRCARVQRSFTQVLLDWPTTMRHFMNELTSFNTLISFIQARIILSVIAAAVYILSPLDILPEAVYGLLGLLDDIFVVFVLGLHLSVIYRQIVISRGPAANHS